VSDLLDPEMLSDIDDTDSNIPRLTKCQAAS